MNIGNGTGTQIGGAGSDLFERMRAAHAEAAEAATGSSEADGAGGSAAADVSGPEAADAGPPLEEAAPLERRLMQAARHVLQGDFDRPGEVRRAVVDTIVEQRWSHVVDAEADSGMLETLRNSLSEDLAFRAEVDNMLLHAARRLGASGH